MVILRKKVSGTSPAALSRFARRAAHSAGLTGKLNILITNDEEIRSLNARFRKYDKATDVLSFPMKQPGFAGEIAISLDIASANAKKYGHKVADEIRILILHGVLHLTGGDHEKDGGKMDKQERRLSIDLRLPPGLIARTERKQSRSSLRGGKGQPAPRQQVASVTSD